MQYSFIQLFCPKRQEKPVDFMEFSKLESHSPAWGLHLVFTRIYTFDVVFQGKNDIACCM